MVVMKLMKMMNALIIFNKNTQDILKRNITKINKNGQRLKENSVFKCMGQTKGTNEIIKETTGEQDN